MSNNFFKDLKESLEEVVAYKNGKLDLRSQLIEVPEPPAKYKAKDIKKIRERNTGYIFQDTQCKCKNYSVMGIGSAYPKSCCITSY